MMNKTWFNIIPKAEGSSEVEISIYDTIGSYDINAKQFAEDIKDIQADTIHLRLNSPGGSVIDGIAIYNSIKRHPAKVVTHIDGLAASMASVIAMAGDEVHMADNALFMIHNPWTVSIGDADELRADADLLDKMQASILSAYGRSQYEPEEIKDRMDAETWFTAQEAYEAGFVDHIDTGLRAAASDIAAMAHKSEINIPADKQIASLQKQLEAVTKTSTELASELDKKSEEVEKLAGQLVDALLEVESAEVAVAKAEENATKWLAELDDAAEALENKDAEVAEAKIITDHAVAVKAAEIVQDATHEAVVDNGDSLGAESDEQLLARYESIADVDDRRDFFAANKTKILRAKTRLINN